MGMKSIKLVITSKCLTFSSLLIVIISITTLLMLIVLLNISPVLDFITYDYALINLNNSLFSKIPINGLLVGIIGALSAILAIVFSLTIISVENISEKYTPYILDKFIKNNHISKYTLYAFVLTIVLSFSLLLVKELLAVPILLFYLLLIIYGFVVCFIYLIKYFYFIFDIINPIKFASILKEEINDYVKNDDKNEAKPFITTIGDITIKSLERQDKNVAQKYISELYGIFLESISKLQKFDYLSMILDSYQRILDYCIKINSELRYKILDVYAEIPLIFLSIQGFSKFEKNIFLEYSNYLNKLFYANKEIINNNDFDLFKSEINSISMRFVDDPKKLVDEIKVEFLSSDFLNPQLYRDTEIIQQKNYLDLLVDKLEKNFTKFEQYQIILEELNKFFELISKHLTSEKDAKKIKEKSEEIRNTLFKFYLDSNFHNTFFMVGAYSLFAKNEKNIDSEKYLRELWLYTNPEDAYAITANKVPVSSDIEFLCNMLFWGGGIDSFWYDNYYFDGYHGSKRYLYTYFLLLLTYLREKQNKDLTIQISNSMDKEELEFRYSFLKQFNLEVKELIDYCDDLIKESVNWTFLLPPKKQEVKSESKQNTETEIVDVNTKEQFENTKKWLENKKLEFEKQIQEIEIYLPLDAEKVEQSNKEILNSFTKYTEISKTAILKEFDLDIDEDMEFIPIGWRHIIPKDCFLEASYVDCSTLWYDYGRNLAFGEINYFIKQLLDNPHIKNIEMDYVEDIIGIYDEIESTINSLCEQGFIPSTLFIPLDYLSRFRHEGMNKESKLFGKFTYSDRQFKLNDSVNLDIIHSSNSTKFEDIIILDKNACIWTFKHNNEDEERLQIEINKYDDDLSQVILSVKTVINLKIDNSDAIKILSIKKNGEAD